MAVTDSHDDTLNEFSVREQESPQTLTSPEHGATAKRKKRRKKRNEEANEQSQVEVCPKPFVDSLFSQEGNVEAAADNPNPALKKKKKKKKKIKNVHYEQQLQTSDPSVSVFVESDVTKGEGARQGDANGNGVFCLKPLLDTPIPIVSHEETAEGTALKPSPTPKKKRKKKILLVAEQICDPSIRIGVEPDVTKDEGSREGDVNENVALFSKPLLDTPIPIVSLEENADATAQNPSPTPKKKSLQGAEQICDPSIRIRVESDVTKEEGSRRGDANGNGGLSPRTLLDAPLPVVSSEENAEAIVQNPSPNPKKKENLQGLEQVCDPPIRIGLESNVLKEETSTQKSNPTPNRKWKKNVQGEQQQQLQTCDPSISIGVESDVKKEEGSQRGDATGNGSLSPRTLLDAPLPIVPREENAEAIAQDPIPNPKKNLQAAEQVCDPSIRIDVEPDMPSEETSTHNSNPTPKRKRKKNVQGEQQQLQTCDPSVSIGVESDVKKEEGSRRGDANGNGSLSPRTLLDAPLPIVPREENAEAIAQDPIPNPKKNLQAAEQVCDPSIRIDVEPDVPSEETSTHNSNPTPKRKRKKNVRGEQQLQTCDPSVSIGVESDVKKEEGSRRGDANGNGGLSPRTLLDAPLPIVPREEKAEAIAQDPSPNPKKNKKNLQAAEQVCDPSIRIDVEPDVPSEETSTHNSNPTPKRKRKKNIQGEQQQLQTCDPSISIGVESDVKKEEGSRRGDANGNRGLSPRTLLDAPLPIVSREENAEAIAQNPSPNPKKKKNLRGAEQVFDPSIRMGVEPDVPSEETSTQKSNPTPKRKRKKKVQGEQQQLQSCDPSISIGVESEVKKEEGSRRGNANGNGALSPRTLLDAPLPIVPGEETAEAIAQGPSPNPKKKNLQAAEQVCDPSIRIGVEPDVPNEETSTQNSNPAPKRKRKKNVQGEQQLQTCDPSISIGVESDVKKEGAQQGNANEAGVSGISEERPIPDSTAPEDAHWKKDSARKKKKALKPEGAEAESIPEPKEPNYSENPQQCTLDLKLKNKAKKGAGAIAEDSGVCSNPEVAPQLYIAATTDLELKEKAELIEVNIEHLQASSKPELESPVDMPTQMKPQKKKIMNTEKKKETKPSEEHAQAPCSNHAPTVRGIIEECPAPEGADFDKPDGKPPETPVQEFLDPVVALSIDPALPVQASSKMTKKKRKRSALIREGAEPNEHDGKPLGTPVQRSIYPIAAPSIEPTIPTGQDPPIDPATPVDPEQMPKKKKRKKRNSVLKNQGLESEKHNADPTAETPFQKTEGPPTKEYMGRGNADQAAKTPVHRTESLRVTKSSINQHGESSLSCPACQQIGHGLEKCKRLKSLSKDEEVCFFCGGIGHSLGKCGVSQAGGRFAKCLFCYRDGHFGYDCPQSDRDHVKKRARSRWDN